MSRRHRQFRSGWNEGHAARKAGQPDTANPYEFSTPDAREWRGGWMEAEVEERRVARAIGAGAMIHTPRVKPPPRQPARIARQDNPDRRLALAIMRCRALRGAGGRLLYKQLLRAVKNARNAEPDGAVVT